MGNYRSRPMSTCSQELLNRILENYSHLEKKLQEDLNVDVEQLTEIQRVCCNGTAEQLASLINSESLGERLENGMTLMHLCCVSAVIAKGDDIKEKEDIEGEGKKIVTQAPCVLQLIKSQEKNDRKDKNHEKYNDSQTEAEKTKSCPKVHSGKEQRDQIRLLLQKGADPAIISKNGFSPLHLASYKVITVEGFGSQCCLFEVPSP